MSSSRSLNEHSPPKSSSSKGSRMTSPEPSIRHISNKRVNNFERKPLLKRSHSNSTDYKSLDDRAELSIGKPSKQQTSRFNNLASGSSPLKAVSTSEQLRRGGSSEQLRRGGSFDNDPHDDPHDQMSIITNPRELAHSSSINYLSPPSTSSSFQRNADHQAGHSGGYTPSQARTFDKLSWKQVLPYYLPILSWLPEYSVPFFLGDLVGGLSLATFQIPLCLSYATSLAHVPVTCGFFSLGIAPLIYMVFGSVPQMVVGPEAPISLIVGQAVEPLLHHAKKKQLDPVEFVVAITVVSGASLLGFGLGRFGFLDNVLSESLLKGFISGVGIIMIINAMIAMVGIDGLLKDFINNPDERDVHSPFDKAAFLFTHFDKVHWLTFIISITGLIIILMVRILKSKAATRSNSKIVYIPEILIVVVLATWLCQINRWDLKGIEVIGKIKSDDTGTILYNPFSRHSWKWVRALSASGFLCAMLGFFESTTASKSLGSTYNLPISSNRELVALGFINIVGSVFGALPAFGGYGRSKINAISAKTTTSGAIMGLLVLATSQWLTSYLYFIPKCILSVVTCVIGISLIDEAPYELYFHWRTRGYNELVTFAVTVATTLFFSMETGIAVGLVYSLIRVIKHSAESRIQILGRYPGTNTFLDADIARTANRSSSPGINISHDGASKPNVPSSIFEKSRTVNQYDVFTDDNYRPLNVQALEEIEGCLIIKIPEPLTFVNTNDLKSRLKRVEMYGSTRAHPASERSRDVSMTQYIIFDLDGMSDLDSSAAQMLVKLLKSYQERNIKTFFVRVPHDPDMRKRLHACGITNVLTQDLEIIKYFEFQQALAHKLQLNSAADAGATIETTSVPQFDIDAMDLDDASQYLDLIESSEEPYFGHISDALKIIDLYEELHSEDPKRFFDEPVTYQDDQMV